MQRLQGEGQKEIKMEKQDPDGSERGKQSGEGGRVFRAFWTGSSREFLPGTAPKPVKQEPEEGLQQRWEAQWQEFLRTVQAPCVGGRDPPHPPPPASGEGQTAFPASSRGAADSSQWPQEEPVAQPLPGLPGEAAQVSEQSLGSPTVRVKEETPEEEEPVSVETRRQHFRQFCYWEAQRPREVCRQLQELCHRWLKPETHSKEQILELVTLEQFLAVLPPAMQSWVRGGGPQTCAQAVALAEEFLRRLDEAETQEQQSQVLEPFEEVIVNSPKAERDSSDTEEMQLSLRVEDDGKARLFDGGQTSEEEEEESCRPERLEQAAAGRIAVERARGKCSQDPLGSENERQDLAPERPTATKVGKTPLGRLRGTFFPEPEVDEPLGRQQGLKPHQENPPGRTLRKDVDCGEEGGDILNESLSQDRSLEHVPANRAAESAKSVGQSFDLVQPAKTPSYKCSYCGKTWPCQSQLRRHVKIHTGERPHKCPDCGKSFSTSSNLSQHKRVHTGERPYSCKACGKSYRRRASLVQHERETCRKGSHLNASAVGYVVLGNCTLLCMKKATQGGRNRVIAPKGAGGEVPLAAQPLNLLTGCPQERSHASD